MRRGTSVGIIGTGMLGAAVARRLLGCGFEVSVYNRTASKAARLGRLGAHVAESPAEVAGRSRLVITVLRDARAVRRASFGRGGIVAGARRGTAVADMSTIGPSESRGITSEFAAAGIKKLDVPVMGGPNVAVKGGLAMMASGDRRTYRRFAGVFGTIADRRFFVGGPGDAHAVKLAMNLQITMLALGLSEGIVLSERCGIDPGVFLRVLNSTYFSTGMSRKKAYGMVAGSPAATFTLANLRKDIAAMVRTARGLGVALPMTERAGRVYGDAVAGGLGGLDYTGIIGQIRGRHRPKGSRPRA